MEMQAKIYVAGHRGLVGSSILRALDKAGYKNIVYRTHQELDLTNYDTDQILTVKVEGANGFTAVDYDVFYIDNDGAESGSTTFNITIA